jgi:hypothetical protein
LTVRCPARRNEASSWFYANVLQPSRGPRGARLGFVATLTLPVSRRMNAIGNVVRSSHEARSGQLSDTGSYRTRRWQAPSASSASPQPQCAPITDSPFLRKIKVCREWRC